MDDERPLAVEAEPTKGTSTGSMDARHELLAYASRLKTDFERQKLSRAAGRHARYDASWS